MSRIAAKGRALTTLAIELADAWLAPLGFEVATHRDESPRVACRAAPPRCLAHRPRSHRAGQRDPRLPSAGCGAPGLQPADHTVRRRLGRARSPASPGRVRRPSRGRPRPSSGHLTWKIAAAPRWRPSSRSTSPAAQFLRRLAHRDPLAAVAPRRDHATTSFKLTASASRSPSRSPGWRTHDPRRAVGTADGPAGPAGAEKAWRLAQAATHSRPRSRNQFHRSRDRDGRRVGSASRSGRSHRVAAVDNRRVRDRMSICRAPDLLPQGCAQRGQRSAPRRPHASWDRCARFRSPGSRPARRGLFPPRRAPAEHRPVRMVTPRNRRSLFRWHLLRCGAHRTAEGRQLRCHQVGKGFGVGRDPHLPDATRDLPRSSPRRRRMAGTQTKPPAVWAATHSSTSSPGTPSTADGTNQTMAPPRRPIGPRSSDPRRRPARRRRAADHPFRRHVRAGLHCGGPVPDPTVGRAFRAGAGSPRRRRRAPAVTEDRRRPGLPTWGAVAPSRRRDARSGVSVGRGLPALRARGSGVGVTVAWAPGLAWASAWASASASA